jgi:hypothetical protein
MEIQDLDISEYLDDPEVIAEYLNAAIEENDPAFFLREGLIFPWGFMGQKLLNGLVLFQGHIQSSFKRIE